MLWCEDTNKQSKKLKKLGNTLKKVLLCIDYWLLDLLFCLIRHYSRPIINNCNRMEIVLLSGGSGKRLWPLSNGTRLKQFLQLLHRPDGQKESMVQRVVRQINEAELASSITIVACATQRDSIESQLDANVKMVTEPENRDTFPAIALAAAHLAMERGCSRDEVVVAMPCDAYTENAYFDSVRTMVSLIEDDVTELVMMGIAPTNPSTKYGYIVPAMSNEPNSTYRLVQQFVEKPHKKKAKELLAKQALWNSGVFVFRLGYIIDLLGKYIQTTSYAEVCRRYAELPKTSFDYEVAEKATSAAMVLYEGQWKDLGTWEALTKELPVTVMGNVVMGAETKNTTVINELGLPVVCDGISDAVVIAGHDGILVCRKGDSEHIKRYVEPLNHRPMYEERRWGTYRVLDDTCYATGEHALTKSITLKPGKHISYQIHHHRSEVWTFVEGEGLFVLNGVMRKVKAGDTVVIPVEHYHAIKALTELTFIEVQAGHPLIEEDIERFDWDWSQYVE